jgi:arylsulfatase A-like enzyme
LDASSASGEQFAFVSNWATFSLGAAHLQLGNRAEALDHILLTCRYDVAGLELRVDVDSQSLGVEITDSADRGLHHANRLRRAQYRSLASVDDMVEAIFAELANLGEQRNTLAFFISDNGYMWSEHGLTGKGFPYRQAVKVPFFARWPGHIPKNDADRRFAANIDIAPTVLQALSIEPTVPQDGRSLLEGWRRDRIHLEFWCNSVKTACNRWASTWTRTYQFTEYYEAGTTLFREFYDLRADPWQLTNVFRDGVRRNAPANANELAKRLASAASCAAAPAFPLLERGLR